MNILKEIKEIVRFWKSPGSDKKIVFYAEHEGYYSYYEGLIEKLITDHNQVISYITSDKNDPILKNSNNLIKSFYINKLLTFFMATLKCKVCVMTMPDLNVFHIKRSIYPVHYVYVFHALVSTHMAYLENSFDNYDSILCTGQYQVDEIRKREHVRQLKPKKLVEAGYYRLERVYQAYIEFSKSKARDSKKTILVAPSWGTDNLIESVGEELVDVLLRGGYRVIVRPHPEALRRKPEPIDKLDAKFGKQPDFILERSVATDDSMLTADLLICDLSGIVFEYAFGTERPVLFIDSPIKVRNENYEELSIEPLELAIRKEVGIVLTRDEMNRLPAVVSELITDREHYREHTRELRSKYVFNFGHSSEIGANYIMNLTS